MNNPYQQYTKVKISTAAPEELVMMLYDGAVKFSNKAKNAIENKKIEEANNNLARVEAIIDELMLGLDYEQGGQIADNYLHIYDYLKRRVIEANVKKNIEVIDEVVGIIRDLRQTWGEAMKIAKKKEA